MVALKVLDLFCGAGGLSLGFEQAGFDVVSSIDNWQPAIDTIKANRPDVEASKQDVLKLKASNLPKVDVIIGGPPCTEFSWSNRGGNGNISEGMSLVSRFLYFVYMLKPKFWVMENVARLATILPKRIGLKKIGINKEGYFEIPKIKIFNAADFGVPQKRIRMFAGIYPDLKPTHSEKDWINMRKIIEAFPNPFTKPSGKCFVTDPNYQDISFDDKSLEDHFGEYPLMSIEEAKSNKKQKTDHPYYGKMKFPDDLDRPSRTVMATQFNASRETMVIETSFNGKKRYRKPTVRECASLQTYPIDYKFIAKDYNNKYRLVGNSVPAKLSFALATAIKNSL